MKNLSEEALWNAFKEGDLKALATLFKVYYSPLFHYGLKISNSSTITKDCLQDFFLYIYEHRANLASLNNLKPYLYTSFRRSLLKTMKSNRMSFALEVVKPEDIGFHFSKEDLIINQEIKEFKNIKLVSSLNELPKRQREIIYLKYYSNLSVNEIAEILDINYQSVINSLHKAMKRLRQDVALNNMLKKIL